MTQSEREEAINSIKGQLDYGYIDFSESYDYNEIEVIKEALEKQIPKKCDITSRCVMKADRFEPLKIDIYKCPVCHSETGSYGICAHYCINCGQKLDENSN